MSFKSKIEDYTYFLILVALSIVILVVALWKIQNNPEMIVGVFGLFIALISILFYGTAISTISLQIKTAPIQKNPSNILISTRVIIKNVSRFPAKAYINLNLKINGKIEPIPDFYCGKKRWELFPQEGINGHFKIKLKNEIIKAKPKLTMSIKVRNAGFSQYILKYPTGHWHFDLENNKWFNDDFNYHAQMNDIK